MSADKIQSTLEKQIKACIHCGMCLPACPTYRVSGNEGNSPRGRIYIINDLVKEPSQQVSDKSIGYLDNCLSCYACESVCPSDVQYADILDYARHQLGASRYNQGVLAGVRKIFFEQIINSRSKLNLLRFLNQCFAWLLKPASMLIPSLKHLDKLSCSLKGKYKKISTKQVFESEVKIEMPYHKRIVSMPLGCLMDTTANNVHWDCIAILNACGYHVYIPDADCCGALAAHSGEPEIGAKQQKDFFNKLSQHEYRVVMNSAGCGAYCKDTNSNLKIYDLIEAINQAPHKPFDKLDHQVKKQETIDIIYHPACHHNHRQGVADLYLRLLEKIPQLKIHKLQDADICCGSAGLYNVIKSSMANQIGELKAKAIRSTGVLTVATANPGCLTQIKAQLGSQYQVVHPISLIRDITENKIT